MRRVVALALLVAACAEPVPPAPPPESLRADAAAAMAAVETASFSISRDGAPIAISGLEFSSATGAYAAPDRSEAILEVKAGDVTARLGTIAIGDRVWLTDPVSGRWNELEPGTGFNPAVVFATAEGWPAILQDDMTDADSSGHDGSTVRFTGTVSAERVGVLTAGLAEPQPTQVEMLIDRSTFRLRRVTFDTTGPDGVSSWTIELTAYDEPVAVEAPGA